MQHQEKYTLHWHSSGIELNDQTTSDHVESNKNNVADEDMDIAGVHPYALHEDGRNVETQVPGTD